MIFQMFQSSGPKSAPARRRTRAPRYHLALEGLEERTVMSAAAVAHIAMPPAHIAAHALHNITSPKVNVPINVTSASLTGITSNAGQITSATGTLAGTIAGQAFKTTMTITQGMTTATPTSPSVPVLHLRLDPIHLNLLGLKVDTSPICLDINAQTGPGNLLGNLVGGIANLLNQSAPTTAVGTTSLLGNLNTLLNQVVTTTTGAQSSLLGAVNTALKDAFGQLGHTAVTGTTAGATNILTLSVGPLNLNLLGLVVNLDNCSGGPVTVAITAQPGAGNLLGNLLSGVAHLLDSPGNPVGGILAQLNQVLGIVRNARPVV